MKILEKNIFSLCWKKRIASLLFLGTCSSSFAMVPSPLSLPSQRASLQTSLEYTLEAGAQCYHTKGETKRPHYSEKYYPGVLFHAYHSIQPGVFLNLKLDPFLNESPILKRYLEYIFQGFQGEKIVRLIVQNNNDLNGDSLNNGETNGKDRFLIRPHYEFHQGAMKGSVNTSLVPILPENLKLSRDKFSINSHDGRDQGAPNQLIASPGPNDSAFLQNYAPEVGAQFVTLSEYANKKALTFHWILPKEQNGPLQNTYGLTLEKALDGLTSAPNSQRGKTWRLTPETLIDGLVKTAESKGFSRELPKQWVGEAPRLFAHHADTTRFWEMNNLLNNAWQEAQTLCQQPTTKGHVKVALFYLLGKLGLFVRLLNDVDLLAQGRRDSLIERVLADQSPVKTSFALQYSGMFTGREDDQFITQQIFSKFQKVFDQEGGLRNARKEVIHTSEEIRTALTAHYQVLDVDSYSGDQSKRVKNALDSVIPVISNHDGHLYKALDLLNRQGGE